MNRNKSAYASRLEHAKFIYDVNRKYETNIRTKPWKYWGYFGVTNKSAYASRLEHEKFIWIYDVNRKYETNISLLCTR